MGFEFIQANGTFSLLWLFQLIGQAGDLHAERQQGLGLDFALDRFLYLPLYLAFSLLYCLLSTTVLFNNIKINK